MEFLIKLQKPLVHEGTFLNIDPTHSDVLNLDHWYPLADKFSTLESISRNHFRDLAEGR
jgi:hypothetical protein